MIRACARAVAFLFLILGVEAAAQEQHTEFSRRRFEVIVPLLRAEKYAEAERESRKHLLDVEQRVGRESLEAARSMTLLADCLMRLGNINPDETLRLIESAAVIKERILGSEHQETWSLWTMIANRHGTPSGRSRSYELFNRILTAQEKKYGPSHERIADTLNEYAVFLWEAGEFSRALPLAERAMTMTESLEGPDSARLAQILTTVGFVKQHLGDQSGARLALERCLDIRRRKLGPERRLTVAAVNNLATQFSVMQDFAGAVRLHEDANAMRLRILGPNHPDNAIGLHNLAIAHRRLGDVSRAWPILEQARALRERVLGAEHPLLGTTLLEMGMCAVALSDWATARTLLERTLAIFRKTLGESHPSTLAAQKEYATVLARLGLTAAGFDLMHRTARSWSEHLRLSAQTLDERAAMVYAAAEEGVSALDATTGFVIDYPELGPSSRRAAWDTWVHARASVLDEMAIRQRVASVSADPGLARLFAEVRQTRARLAHLFVSGSSVQLSAEIAGAQREKESAERALAEKSEPVRRTWQRERLGFTEIGAALPPDSALVAYVSFERGALPKPTRQLAAFVYRHGQTDVEVVPLGDEVQVSETVDHWRKQVTREAESAGRGGAAHEATMRAAGDSLRRRIWDPVSKLTAGANSVFLVPDGPVHRVNWNALPASGGRYLVETGPVFHYLSAERDIVAAPPARGQGLLAVANPAFDAVPTGRSNSPPMPAALRGATPPCSGWNSLRFSSLPATLSETESISRIWPGRSVTRLAGGAASESEFYRQAEGKRVLHLATHGFFLGSECARASRVAAENPLVLSGLALAGANQRQKAVSGESDGVLLAEEIAALNLEGVEWVVLSACDTGLGWVSSREGVFGLRRAFQIAGAGTIISSLWPVADEAALQWMRHLYRARLSGSSTSQAIRQASTRMLAERRARKLSTHPFYWGAFVASGDWR